MFEKVESYFRNVRVLPDDIEGMQKTHRQDSLVFFVVLIVVILFLYGNTG